MDGPTDKPGAQPNSKQEEGAPKLLLLDLTRLNGSAATSALKQAYFKDWPAHALSHLYAHDGKRLGFRNGAGKTTVYEPEDRARALDACRREDPDVILYRPVADHMPLHEAAMDVITSSDAPFAIWLMDDWPERLRADNPALFDRFNRDLRRLLARSGANYAISSRMASAFGERYGVAFDVLRNGVTPQEWPAASAPAAGPLTMRYAGSLAPDMTLQSVLDAAQAVSRLHTDGLDIVFDGRTHKHWFERYAELFAGLPGVTLTTADAPPEEYRRWLSEAGLLLVAYNFDDASRRYLKYSFANKIPETLASGAPALAYGPAGVDSLDYLAAHNLAKIISERDSAALEAAIGELAQSPAERASLGARGRQHAFTAFDIVTQRRALAADLNRLARCWRPPLLSFAHEARINFDESAFVYEAIGAGERPGVMIDAGAHVGGALLPFARAGWTVHAFEPDAQNRALLVKDAQPFNTVHICEKALDSRERSGVSFYTSPESTGIGSLSMFSKTHAESARIDTTTLDRVIAEHGLADVDFLKIDVEGHELDVLAGLDFARTKPKAIVVEFEDNKTLPRGYSARDLADRLIEQGYSVFASEWHPIKAYGGGHSWKRLQRFPCPLRPDSWGNFIAFREEPAPARLRAAYGRTLKTGLEEAPPDAPGASHHALAWTGATPAPKKGSAMYKSFADRLFDRSPVFARLAHFGYWSLRAMFRRIIGFSGVFALFFLAMAAGALWRPEWTPFWLAGAAAGLTGLIAFLVAGYAQLLMAQQQAARAAENERLRGEIATLAELIQRERADLKTLVSKQAHALEGIVAQLDERDRSLKHFKKAVREDLKAASGQLVGLQALTTELSKRHEHYDRKLPELHRLRAGQERLEAALETQGKDAAQTASSLAGLRGSLARSGVANASLARAHTRQLEAGKLARLEQFWTKTLGLNLTRSQLGYLAHKICLAEDRAEGRLAAPVETMLLRLLASHSLKGEKLDILEIGTLFGVGAACLYSLRSPRERDIFLTLIDPMEGYYGQSPLDPVTGAPICEEVLTRNLSALGAPDEAWRLIRRLSTDNEARSEAGDRLYDMAIIDGDHSVDGVARDFELYGPLVKPGGLLIFDDYDTDDWPGIKPYVDDYVATNPAWNWLGGDFRTGIFRRSAAQSENDVTVEAAE